MPPSIKQLTCCHVAGVRVSLGVLLSVSSLDSLRSLQGAMVAIANGTLKSCGRLDGLGHQSTFETTICVSVYVYIYICTQYKHYILIYIYIYQVYPCVRICAYAKTYAYMYLYMHSWCLDVDRICLDVDIICIYVCMYI